jgi:pyruvate dehydrogenase E1 component beta subunit
MQWVPIIVQSNRYCKRGTSFFLQDAPVIRVTGADVPMPYAKSLEVRAVPQPEVIVNVVKRVLNR